MATFVRAGFAHHENQRQGTFLARWLNRRDECCAHERTLAAAVIETGNHLPVQTNGAEKLRGVPVIGAGRGAIAGTAPDTDVPNRLERLRKKIEG